MRFIILLLDTSEGFDNKQCIMKSTISLFIPLSQPSPPEKHRADLQRRTPLVLEDIEADAAQLVDVGMIDLSQEADLIHACG